MWLNIVLNTLFLFFYAELGKDRLIPAFLGKLLTPQRWAEPGVPEDIFWPRFPTWWHTTLLYTQSVKNIFLFLKLLQNKIVLLTSYQTNCFCIPLSMSKITNLCGICVDENNPSFQDKKPKVQKVMSIFPFHNLHLLYSDLSPLRQGSKSRSSFQTIIPFILIMFNI